MVTSLIAIIENGAGTIPGAAEQQINLSVGEDATINIVVYDSNGDPFDVSNGTILLTVRKAVADTAPTLAREATVTDAANGEAHFVVTKNDTVNLASGKYLYDVWYIEDVQRDKIVPLSTFFLEPSVSQDGDPVSEPTNFPDSNITANNVTINKYFIAGDEVAANTFVRPGSVDGQVVLMGLDGSTVQAIGICMDDGIAGDSVRVACLQGQVISVKSDGSTAIASGDVLFPSTTLAGRVYGVAVANAIGTALGVAMSSADETEDVLVNIYFAKVEAI